MRRPPARTPSAAVGGGTENRVRLTGVLVEPAAVRHSPAGVPIARCLLEHESEQVEAGGRRPIRLRVGVRAAGEDTATVLAGLPAGSSVRVTGFLVRSRQRGVETDPIIISASRIERLASEPSRN